MTALLVSPIALASTFSATLRLSETCLASYTPPIPPRPSSRMISKSPNRRGADAPGGGAGEVVSCAPLVRALSGQVFEKTTYAVATQRCRTPRASCRGAGRRVHVEVAGRGFGLEDVVGEVEQGGPVLLVVL